MMDGEMETAQGALTYRGRPCRHGHDGLRYVSTGVCVPCRLGHDPGARVPRKVKGAILDQRRVDAKRAGLPTYMGELCRRGHDGLRWTTGGSCIECTRLTYRQRKMTMEQWNTPDPQMAPRPRRQVELPPVVSWMAGRKDLLMAGRAYPRTVSRGAE